MPRTARMAPRLNSDHRTPSQLGTKQLYERIGSKISKPVQIGKQDTASLDDSEKLNLAFDEGSIDECSKNDKALKQDQTSLNDTSCGDSDVLNTAFFEDPASESSTSSEILTPLSTARSLRRARPGAPLAYVREAADDIPELHCEAEKLPSIFEEAETARPLLKRHPTRSKRRICRFKPDLSTIREVAETSTSSLDLSSLLRSFYSGFERERYEMRVSIGLSSSRALTLADPSKTIVDEASFSGKSVSVASWHQNTPDRRALKGSAKTRLTNGDVYPHEPSQDEDNLSSEKVRKGYTTGPIPYEHASLNGTIDREDISKRTQQFYVTVNAKKVENNLISGKKSKDSVSQLPAASPGKEKETPRPQWYQSVAKGKAYGALMQAPPSFKDTEKMFKELFDYRIEPSRAIWVMKLAANIAGNNNSRGKNKTFNGEKFAVDYAQVLTRAIRQIFNRLFELDTVDDCEETSEKWHYFSQLSREAFDEGVVDRQDFINELINIFTDVFLQRKKADTRYQLQLWFQFYFYFAPAALQNIVLARRIATMMAQKIVMLKEEFEEDEAELLTEIREGRYDYDSLPADEDSQDSLDTDPPPPALKSVKIEAEPMDTSDSPMKTGTPKDAKAETNDVNMKNVMGKKIKEEPMDEDEKAKEKKDEGKEGEKRKGIQYDPEHPDKFVFDVMFATEDYKCVLNALVTTLFACIREQPGAIVYNKFHVGLNRAPYMLTQLGGSPLDYLSIPLLDLPFDYGSDEANDNVLEDLEMYEHDISLRSDLVQKQWVLTFNSQRLQAKLVHGCSDVVGNLDMVDPLTAGTVPAVFERIFMRINEARYEHEVVTRIRLCLTWAITVQRDGEWRGWLVAKILKLLLDTRPHDEPYGFFGGNHISLILVDFINNDLPKPGDEHYYKEFANFCSLFFELTRFGVITHANLFEMWNTFHQTYCDRTGMNAAQPAMAGFPPVRTVEDHEEKRKEADAGTSEDPNRLQEQGHIKMEVDNVIGIKMEGESVVVKEEPKETLTSFITVPDDPVDGFRLLDEDIPPLQHLVIQLPIPSVKTLMDERTVILYGDVRAKNAYVAAAKRVALSILSTIREKMFYRWNRKKNDVMFARRATPQELKELLQRMKQHTLFDRQQIANWVADGFINSVHSFLANDSSTLPTHEAFDLVCSLYEQTNNMHGFFQFAELVLSQYLPSFERTIRNYNSMIITGLVSAQYTFVISSYLVKHLQYFVHYEKAKTVVNLLYRSLEKYLKAAEYPRNGFGRAAAAAYYHLRDQLIITDVVADSTDLLGGENEFDHVMIQGESASKGQSDYNKHFMKDIFQLSNLRIYDNHDFKKRLPSFKNPVDRYSFVVNAFVIASKMERDFDRLNDLASFCSHWTAHHIEMGTDWMGAFRALCNAKSSHYGFRHLLEQVDVSDCSIHYSLSTFALLLASKYVFSVPTMVAELLNSIFASVQKRETAKASSRSSSVKNDYESEPSACLALLFLAQVSCTKDEPFLLSEHYRGRNPVKKLLEWGCADLNILSMTHWCEMNLVAYPMIVNLGIMNDILQSRVRDHNLKFEVTEGEGPKRREYKKEYLPVICRQVLISVCEQDWVKDRMWKVASQDDLVAFSQDLRLKQNCLGQQLLRLGTRRRCERETLAQLAVCNGNSKRALIDKLLSTLTIWNYRATLYDLRLMIKEISPDGSSKHAQQGAIAADALMAEIAKCARELYVQAFRQNKTIMKKDERFSFSSVTNYLLLPTLIDDCPTPANMPSSFSASFKSKFLSEVCTMLDVGQDPSEEKMKMSGWLIQDRSFLNVIIACMKGTDREDQAAKENLMNQILKQIQDLAKIKEDDVQTTQEERIDIGLRLQLVGYVFNQVTKKDTAEAWALILFQLMLHGVVTPMRNLQMYNTVFDMLANIIIWSLTDQGTVLPATDKNEKGEKNEKSDRKEEAKYRFPYYMQIVRKFRKELADTKTTMETRHLHAFLPLPKAFQQLLPLEPFGTSSSNGHKKKKTGVGMRRGRPSVQVKKGVERIKISAFENLPGYNPDNTTRKFANLSFYMATKLDISMTHPYKVIERLIGHCHPMKGIVTNPLQLENGEMNNFFLEPVPMEEVGEPPWITKRKETKDIQRKAREARGEADGDIDDTDASSDYDASPEEEKEEDDNEKENAENPKSVATPAALTNVPEVMSVKTEPKQNVKEESSSDIVVLDSPIKNIKAEPMPTPSKESELAKIMSQPFQATPSYPPAGMMVGQPGPSTVAPAPVKASRRKSTTPKEPAEKKERKRTNKRNASGLTLQTTMTPPQMNTPPKGGGIFGVPLTHPSQLQQGPSQQPDWPPNPAHIAPPSMQQDQLAQPRETQSTAGPATTLSQLMGHHQPPAQPPLSQMQQMQQQQAAAAAQRQQQQQQAMMQQMQQQQQAQHDSTDASAKTKLHDMVLKRQDEKAARTHGMPPDYVTPDKSQGGMQKRASPDLGRMQQQPHPSQQQAQMMQQQPTGGHMGQPGMMQQQRQPDHKQTNELLANHIKNQQMAARAAVGHQQQPGPSAQQPGMPQQPHPQQPHPAYAQNPQQAQQRPHEINPDPVQQQQQQQQQRLPPTGGPTQQRPPMTMEEQRRMQEMQQRNYLAQQQQLQQQQQQQYDAAGAKMPPMGSGANPYPNRPAAPALNQSTNPPQQPQPGLGQPGLGQPPNYQAYQQQPHQQMTPAQMERRKILQQQAMQQQQQAHMQQQQQLQHQQRQQQQGNPQMPQSAAAQTQLQQQQQLQWQQQQHQARLQQQQQQAAQQRFQQAQQALNDPSQADPSRAQAQQQYRYQQQPPQ